MAKAASVGLFGIFSQKVRHQFHCNSCGYGVVTSEKAEVVTPRQCVTFSYI